MLNNVRDGKYIRLPLTGKVSGAPVVLGNFTGVAREASTVGADDVESTVVDVTDGIVDLSVVENQGVAINNGDPVYINPADDVVSNNAAHTYFGIAYSNSVAGALIAIGQTATISVKMKGASLGS